MDIASSSVIVVGGSRGLGLAVVEALASRGARITVVARDRARLEDVAQRLGVSVVSADATDGASARELVAANDPQAVVFAAGAVPPTKPINTIGWAEFSSNWEVDARGALMWLQAALNVPMRPGSRFVTMSSGAAIGGSPLSGGYGGAKRMQWFATNYAAAYALEAGLGVNFQTFVTAQMIAGTAVGDAGSMAYSRKLGISQAEFLKRFGKPATPADVGEAVVRLLSEPALEAARAFRFNAGDGLVAIEPAAA